MGLNHKLIKDKFESFLDFPADSNDNWDLKTDDGF